MTAIKHLSRRGFVAAASSSGHPRNTRSLFGFSWFGSDKKSNPPSTSNPASTTPPSPPDATTLQSSSTPTNEHHDENKVAAATRASALAKRDEEVRQKLLDMDGGSAGFEFEDGKPAGGQGRETRRNMFRIM